MKPPRSSSEQPRVPAGLRPTYDQIVALTEPFCAEHLDADYAELAREMAAALSRKRPSPLVTGKPRSWAAGILYALGQVNFLFDPSQTPHLEARRLCELMEMGQNAVSTRAKQIRDLLGTGQGDPKWWRRSRLGDNPFVWHVELPNGMIVDARHLPRDLQEQAFAHGLISYVPADPN
ncbi:MAG TPA: DUF6398 domain-containing protein [Longimicrobium sp.]|nr:DUF6398 domain-containing protein [Longimicrobium sp.]